MADAGANLAPGGLDKGGMWELAQRVASEEAHRKEKEAQTTLAASATPMADAITSKLTSSFSPTFLQVSSLPPRPPLRRPTLTMPLTRSPKKRS